MKQIRGVSEIANDYDVVLLDQFGVIHDGRNAYPNALHAINKLHDNGIKIIILSNSSKESHYARDKLREMGVEVERIHGIITSGELALSTMKSYMKKHPHARTLHFNWTSSRGSVDLSKHSIHATVPLISVSPPEMPNPSCVDLILAHGTDGVTQEDGTVLPISLDILRSWCQKLGGLRTDLPFFCANPDLVTVDGPQIRTMPGTLAYDFELAGGRVERLGKPARIAYEKAQQLVGGKGRMLAIGDSVGHDIFGALEMDIDCLYVIFSFFKMNYADSIFISLSCIQIYCWWH